MGLSVLLSLLYSSQTSLYLIVVYPHSRFFLQGWVYLSSFNGGAGAIFGYGLLVFITYPSSSSLALSITHYSLQSPSHHYYYERLSNHEQQCIQANLRPISTLLSLPRVVGVQLLVVISHVFPTTFSPSGVVLCLRKSFRYCASSLCFRQPGASVGGVCVGAGGGDGGACG